MADTSLRHLKSLCTAAELKLLQMSVGAPLKRQSAADLVRTLSLLRGARDKWRTQTTTQRRRARSTRGGNAMLTAGRSEEKTLAFAEAIVRVERQIERLGAPAVRRSGPAVAPRQRAKEHRQERATTRSSLRAELKDAAAARAGRGAVTTVERAPRNKAQRPGSAKPRVTGATGAKVTRSSDAARGAKVPKPVKAGKRSASILSTGSMAEADRPAGEPAWVALDAAARIPRAKGRGAIKSPTPRALASEQRSELRRLRGLNTHLVGHVSSQGRRNQARRDTKAARAVAGRT